LIVLVFAAGWRAPPRIAAQEENERRRHVEATGGGSA
jgi:hypothetical protein